MPTSIPGSAIHMTNVTPGELRQHGGLTYTCPQAFFDPDMRVVIIDGRIYPLERVHYMERARMAKNKIKSGY